MASTMAAGAPATPENDSDVKVVRSHSLNLPVFVESLDTIAAGRTNVASPSMSGAIPHVVATTFKITAPASQLKLAGVSTDRLGFRHELFDQEFHGIPVITGQLRIHYRPDGSFHAASGRYYPIPPAFDLNPHVTAEAAAFVASAPLGDGFDVYDNELVIVDPGWYGDPPIGPHLAYRLTLVDRDGHDAYGVFIDAHNGQLLDRWSLLCHAKSRHIYDGTGQSAVPGASARQEGDPPTGIEDVDEAYDYLGDVYDFFHLAFGRDGIDNNGGGIVATVNVDDTNVFGCPNAAFDLIRGQLLFCSGATADDVVAHEWTHGLTAETANLLYQNQSGQLNESFSDVFGELVDQYNGGAESAGSVGVTPWVAHSSGGGTDAPNATRTASCSTAPMLSGGVRWLIGEDATSLDGPFRDMWNPSCYGDPPTANDPLEACLVQDNGGVHSGNGVPNHAFAMVCDGATFNGFTIDPIGPAKAAAVWYRALTVYLTVGSDFQDAYLALNQAASDLIGTMPNDPRTGQPTGIPFTAFDAQQVDNALRAVEMDTPGRCGEADPPLDSTPPVLCDQADTVFFDDSESGAGGWTVSNSGPPTPYDWELVTDLPFGRSGTAWFVDDRNVGDCNQVDEAAVHDLTSPSIPTPADFDTLTLTFLHFVETEPRFDGGEVELEVNGGPWQPIPQAAYRFNGNNISLFQPEQHNTNPIAGSLAFSGAGGGWGTSVIELADLVAPGDAIRIRFRFGKDSCFGYNGWWVDDVRVSACRSSGDCNENATPDEVDRATGPAPQVLLDQPINLRALANLSDLDPDPTLGPNKIAEDLVLLHPASITKVRVHGGYDDDVATTDDFTVEVFEDDGGLPGTLIASYPSIASTRQSTGNIFFVNQEYTYEMTLPAPLTLPAGRYLVGVYNNTSQSPGNWRWGRSWFGWTPGAAFQGQGCDWCRINTANFAIEVLGQTIGRSHSDLNADGQQNTADLDVFASLLLAGPQGIDQSCAADMNGDGVLNGLDIEPFAACLLTQACGD